MNLVVNKLACHGGSRIYQYLMAVLITMPLLSFGMVQGWLSPMIPLLRSPSSPSVEYNSSQISWVASVTYVTAVIMGVPLGYLTDKLGRKVMSLITVFSLCLYWAIKLVSLEPWALILARAVAGFPCSACYIVLPIYLKEISDKDIRGVLGTLITLTRNVGYLASYICADILDVRLMLWLGFIVPTITFVVFLALPETPEYLVKQGKAEEAKSVLAWLRGTTVNEHSLQMEVNSLVHRDKQQASSDVSPWATILRDPATFKAFIISVVIKLGQQFDGYLIVLIYAGFIFKQAAENSEMRLTPNKQVMLIGTVQLVGSFVATALVEKTGRKMLLVSTSFFVGVGMLVMAVWFYLVHIGAALPGWVPVIAMCLCIFADAAGFQPISYIIITDLFTFELRSHVSAFVNICAKASNFVQMKWFHSMNEIIGIHWTLCFFAGVSFGSSVYTLLVFPETKQKSVEEIYAELTDGKKKKTGIA